MTKLEMTMTTDRKRGNRKILRFVLNDIMPAIHRILCKINPVI
jgi:hypothetical protein